MNYIHTAVMSQKYATYFYVVHNVLISNGAYHWSLTLQQFIGTLYMFQYRTYSTLLQLFAMIYTAKLISW